MTHRSNSSRTCCLDRKEDRNVLEERSALTESFLSSDRKLEGPLAYTTKFCYGFGDTGNGFVVSSISVWYLFFLTDSLALSPLIAGLALILARVTNACGDLLAGWLSDRTSTRWGKKRPFLLWGCIPYALLFCSAWSPFDTSSTAGVLLLLGVLVLFNLSFSLVFVPYASLTASITANYRDRTSLTAFRIGFSQSAMLLGATLPGIFLAATKGNSSNDFSLAHGLSLLSSFLNCSASQAAFLACSTIGSLLVILGCMTTFLGTRECQHASVELRTDADTSNLNQRSQLRLLFGELRENSAFRIAVLMIVFNNSALTIIAASLPYAISYLLANEKMQTALVGTVFITAVLSIPFWTWLAHSLGKRKAYSRAMLIYSAVLLCLPLVFTKFPVLSFPAVILAGFFYGAALMLPWAMIPDVIEHSQARGETTLGPRKGPGKGPGISQARRDGLYYSGTTFCYKTTSGISAAMLAACLSFVGYTPHVAQNTATLIAICVGIGPAPALLLAIASQIAKRFPVDAETHLRSLEKLKA